MIIKQLGPIKVRHLGYYDSMGYIVQFGRLAFSLKKDLISAMLQGGTSYSRLFGHMGWVK